MQQAVSFTVYTIDDERVDLRVSVATAAHLAGYLRYLAIDRSRIITLDQAVELMGGLGCSSSQVKKLWSGMVRSGVFGAECSVCEPRTHYCPHYEGVTFAEANIISGLDQFEIVAKDTPMVGQRTVELAHQLASALTFD